MSGRTNPYDIESVRGYSDALQIYRIPASSKWQVRLFVDRKHLRKSTRCMEKRDAIEFAKRFHDEIKIAQRLDFDVHRDTFAACADRLMKRQDTLVVCKLDRLARSVADLTKIVERLRNKHADLRVLNINLDTSSATGKLILNLLGSIAEFEREMLLERQKVGIARAKAEGRYKGRKPTARARADEVRRLKARD